jgi:DinB superfamily
MTQKSHPMVAQLRFTRSEWLRGLQDVTAEEAARHFEPINSISWMVGHLAWHEQLYWLQRAQGKTLFPEVDLCANGAPPHTPDLDDMWRAWKGITAASDPYLDSLTPEIMQTYFMVDGKPARENIGTNLMRITYHYWYHLGESQAARQLLGHRDLPGFVGGMGSVMYDGW